MMLMFYDNRMGVPVTVPVCRLPPWAPQARWFAPSSSCGMTDIIDDLHTAPPGSPQSDSDSTRSSTISAYNPQGIESAGNYYATFRIQTSNQPITSAPATSPVLPSRKNTWELPVFEQNIKPEAVFECRWRGCGEIFISLDNLSSHVSSVHADVDKGLFYCGWEGCSRGDKGFNARYKMLVHVRTHTNEKPHKCSQCEKSFSRAENLKIHTRSHSGEKPYVCTVEGCNKAYSNSSDRFKHTRTHSVDKPYCCKFTGCQKRYTDPSSLRKHVKTYKHISTSPLPSNGLRKSHEFSLQHRIPQNFYEKPFSNVGSTQTGVDFVERNVKNVQRKYSFSENDLPVEDKYSNISNYRFKTPPAYLEYNTHDFEYLSSQEKYVLKSGLPVSDVSSGIETRDVIESSQFVVEPLNLERSWDEDIYENGVLNLEKKFKSESLMSDRPLDLSLRKKYL